MKKEKHVYVYAQAEAIEQGVGLIPVFLDAPDTKDEYVPVDSKWIIMEGLWDLVTKGHEPGTRIHFEDMSFNV
jgi:hypothetical protein